MRWMGSTDVVVKTPHDQSADAAAEVKREAVALARVSRHPHIIGLIGYSDRLGDAFIALEHAAGGSAKDAIVDAAEPWPVWRVLRAAGDAASGLEFLHKRNIVHRDIAARNVLLNGDGRGMLADFGLSRAVEADTSGGQTAASVGPVRWMAPEAMRERRFSPASDVYMLGMTLWEMLAKTAPYPGTDPLAVARGVLSGELRPRRLPEDVCPPAVWSLLAQCLEQDATKRPSAAEVRKKLQALADQSSPASGHEYDEMDEDAGVELGRPGSASSVGDIVSRVGMTRLADAADALEDEHKAQFVAAAQKGDALANLVCWITGWWPVNGTTTVQRLGDAVVRDGGAAEQYALGWCYVKGKGVAEDEREAVRLFRLAADQGDARGQVNLGVCYDNGMGVAKDRREAARLYRLAADQGNATAANYLAAVNSCCATM